jgi:hypothetical protein
MFRGQGYATDGLNQVAGGVAVVHLRVGRGDRTPANRDAGFMVHVQVGAAADRCWFVHRQARYEHHVAGRGSTVVPHPDRQHVVADLQCRKSVCCNVCQQPIGRDRSIAGFM